MQREATAKNTSMSCTDLSRYMKITKIGQGTFGEVFKARDCKSNRLVALKKILMDNEKEGFPITALREIKILQKVFHRNIVKMLDICSSKAKDSALYTFYIVFEFCEHDLAGLLANSQIKFTTGEIKMFIKQLLQGMFQLHISNIIHRDIKASNILITREGILKIADFGLARICSRQQQLCLTNRVVTLWYRPPELFLGERNYGTELDLWGIGCIMAELWTRTPIMQGKSEQHQLFLISQLCGSITPESFPDVQKLDLYNKIELPQGLKRRVTERLRGYIKTPLALELIEKFLALNPKSRITCEAALDDDFLWTPPMPCNLSNVMSQINTSMFELTAAQRRNEVPAPQQRAPPPDDQYRDIVY